MLETYARAQFVLSPRGNGVDCHRTWDVLAVGAIPVVLRHGPAFDAVFTPIHERQPQLPLWLAS